VVANHAGGSQSRTVKRRGRRRAVIFCVADENKLYHEFTM